MLTCAARHTVGASLGGLGVALASAATVGYVAYTLGGVARLQRPLLSLRRPAIAVGCAAAGLSAAIAPSPVTLGALTTTLGLAAYAWRRQWLVPRAAPEYALTNTPILQGLCAVLPDGRGVPLRALSHDRVATVGPWLVVHCGLARSVTVFERPAEAVRAVLPHASGFILRVGDHHYDGVDGAPMDGGPLLRRHHVRLARASTLATEQLWSATGRATTERAVTPRVPGARGVADPMALGRVSDGQWSPIDLDATSPSPAADFLLARWAARARSLPTA